MRCGDRFSVINTEARRRKDAKRRIRNGCRRRAFSKQSLSTIGQRRTSAEARRLESPQPPRSVLTGPGSGAAKSHLFCAFLFCELRFVVKPSGSPALGVQEIGGSVC